MYRLFDKKTKKMLKKISKIGDLPIFDKNFKKRNII